MSAKNKSKMTTKVDPDIWYWLSSADRRAYTEDPDYWNTRFKQVSEVAHLDPTEDYEDLEFAHPL
jgi:hypothetical protein